MFGLREKIHLFFVLGNTNRKMSTKRKKNPTEKGDQQSKNGKSAHKQISNRKAQTSDAVSRIYEIFFSSSQKHSEYQDLYNQVFWHGFNKPVFLISGSDDVLGTAFIANISETYLLLNYVNFRYPNFDPHSDLDTIQFLLCEPRRIGHNKKISWCVVGCTENSNYISLGFELPDTSYFGIPTQRHEMRDFKLLRKTLVRSFFQESIYDNVGMETMYHLVLSYLVPVDAACYVEPEYVTEHHKNQERLQKLKYEDLINPGNALSEEISSALIIYTPLVPVLTTIVFDYLFFIQPNNDNNNKLDKLKTEFVLSFTTLISSSFDTKEGTKKLDFGNSMKRVTWCIGNLTKRNILALEKLCQPENESFLVEAISNFDMFAPSEERKDNVRCDNFEMEPFFQTNTTPLHLSLIKRNIGLFQTFFNDFNRRYYPNNCLAREFHPGGNQLIHYIHSFHSFHCRANDEKISIIARFWLNFL